jgi:hypothetical protein
MCGERMPLCSLKGRDNIADTEQRRDTSAEAEEMVMEMFD